MRTFKIVAVAIGILSVESNLVVADNWPQWRGPEGNGVASAGDYPVEFSDSKNVDWSVELPGRGSSTPAVWGDRILVTCDIDGQDGVVGYESNGEELWQTQLGPGRPGEHRNGSGSNPSPVTDGEHLIVYYKSGTVACLNLAGEVLWQHNLQEEYAEDTLWWDLGTSPVLVDGMAVIAVMQEGESYLIAYDVASGDVAWRAPRNFNVNTESNHAYTTPNVVEVNGEKQIVVWGADHLTGHDVATGEQLWKYSGFNPQDEPNWRVIASAAATDGVAVVPYGRAGIVAAVSLGQSGDVTQQSDILWEIRGRNQGSDVPTPAIREGLVYLLTDVGGLACHDLESGAQRWSAELPRSSAKFYASPILAGDQLFCAREDGMIFAGKITDQGFQLLSENPMGEQIIATPVAVDDALLVRGEHHLWRLRK